MHEELKALLGIDCPDSRLEENLEAYQVILGEIEKLRTLDLTDVHPAIVYDPLIPYRSLTASPMAERSR